MKISKPFLYRLHDDSEYESIITDDAELLSLYEECSKYYKKPIYNKKHLQITYCKNIGEFSLYLLSEFLTDDKNISDITKSTQLDFIRLYLLKCINNENYCNNKLFLTFIRYYLHIQKLPHCDYYASNYSNNKISTSFDDSFNSIVENLEPVIFNKDYLCNDLLDLVIVSLYEIFSKGYKIKKCRNCDKFFISENSSIFCNYTCPKNKSLSCFNYSRNTDYVSKRKNDPVQNTYTKICNLLRKRFYDARDANPCNEELKKASEKILDDFKDDYTLNQKIKYTSGKITKDELLNYLEEQYNYFKNNPLKGGSKNGSQRTNKK